MFKLVVLFAFVAASMAKPGYYGHLEHHAPVVVEKVIAPIAVPAAVSHSYRKDVISEPVIAAHAVPVIAKTVVASPYYPLYGHEGYHGLHGLHGHHGLHGLSGLHGYGFHGHGW